MRSIVQVPTMKTINFFFHKLNNIFAVLIGHKDRTPSLNLISIQATVLLQENNAIAEIDMVTETISEIRGLGFKDWKQYKLDPSDSDGGKTYMYRKLFTPCTPEGALCKVLRFNYLSRISLIFHIGYLYPRYRFAMTHS